MTAPKIAIYAIGLNEAANIPAWLASTRGCDELYYVDTGSTDGSQKLVEELSEAPGAIVEITVRPWRFDDARNASLAIVPADVDICVCLDLDERLCEGWRERLLEVWTPGVTNVRYPYQFAPGNVYLHHRIHTRHGYRWKYPDHEMLYASMGSFAERLVTIEGAPLIVQHQDKAARDRSGTLARLEQGIREYPQDTRMQFYYGRELHYAGRHAEAIDRLETYLARAKAIHHPVEKIWASEVLAACYKALAGESARAGAASGGERRCFTCDHVESDHTDPRRAEGVPPTACMRGTGNGSVCDCLAFVIKDHTTTMLGLWDYSASTPDQRYGGDDLTYVRGMAFLDDCETVEDWGCGAGYAKRFCKGTYRGVDGSAGPVTDVVADLRERVADPKPDGIFMRHILEHNVDWRKVLQNAIDSFVKKLVIVLFTPFQDETGVLATNPTFGNVPDIGFRREDILEPLGGLEVRVESVETKTQYGIEHLLYIVRDVG